MVKTGKNHDISNLTIIKKYRLYYKRGPKAKRLQPESCSMVRRLQPEYSTVRRIKNKR